ncbi:Imm42 family immunity protein [Hyphomicrobium sp. D-2]|uniref:Imm42 family immunity protein n=1 Tax=Hyphomicrobium sp. D-2 TaxID=3041621 RepID=UPI00245536AC|nr:Imm42 family immunity protein [Hyphomicrobium sp. D-2]MDH4981436.1 Imm42 family immunity protein [Hyphomicrobium sp. D-2]
MFGKFCYWCGGLRVGNYELGTSLRDVLFELDRISIYHNSRASTRFASMPTKDLFQQLDSALFSFSAETLQGLPDKEQWARHNMCPSVDIFDGWKIFLCDTNDEAGRLIFSKDPFDGVTELCLAKHEVDLILAQTRVELDATYKSKMRQQ